MSQISTEEKYGTAIPSAGYLRLSTVLKIIPVSKTRWYEGIKSGLYPKPVRIGPRTSAYRAKDIRGLVERIERGELTTSISQGAQS